MAMAKKELVSKATQEAIARIEVQNVAHINDAIVAYKADLRRRGFEDKFGVLNDIQPVWVANLAHDATLAKTALRNIFRNVTKCGKWNEETQRLCINGTATHNPDNGRIIELFNAIVAPYQAKLTTYAELELLSRVRNFFAGCQDNPKYQVALDTLAPNARRDGRKLSKIFNDFAKAIGVFSDVQIPRDKPEHVTSYPYLFAQLADELNGRKLKFKLYLSLNPADFITASNPFTESRSDTCVSCHSFNRPDYSYSAGNVGYARDEVTFIVFTVSNPDDAESFYNRKVTRQFCMYQTGNGVLVQSKLYPNGNDTATQTLYRDLIQRAISEGEKAINLWATYALEHKSEFGLLFRKADGFGGYADWLLQPHYCKLSIRKDTQDYHDFEVGATGLCVICGDEVYGSYHYCDSHDDRERCEHCDCVHVDEEDGARVTTPDGYEGWVCSSCLDAYYRYCDECCTWHHESEMEEIWGCHWVCADCRDEFYCQCDDCGSWEYKSDAIVVYRDGEQIVVCDTCRDRFYCQCDECGEYFHKDDLTVAFDQNGNEGLVCNDCLDYHYCECERCGRYVHEYNFNPTDTGGYCEDCRPYVETDSPDNE